MIMTLAGFNRICAAVYRPELEIIPTAGLPPVIPFTLQVTSVFVVPVTVAVNCCACPRNSEAGAGSIVIVTFTGGGGGVGPDELVLPQPAENAMIIRIMTRVEMQLFSCASFGLDLSAPCCVKGIAQSLWQ
jgi:hypothetical protein